MDTLLLFQAVGALCIVIGLIFIVFYLVRFCESKEICNLFSRTMKLPDRLSIIESKKIDAKNSLVLTRCDDEEYLILLGSSQNLILQTTKRKL